MGSAQQHYGSKNRRVIFCVDQSEISLLHAFMKKTQKTPQQDIDLALRRMKGSER
ncbi:MAG: type II toxin-antitoxin system RelE/ParE family toxin [Terriglobia bacterium]